VKLRISNYGFLGCVLTLIAFGDAVCAGAHSPANSTVPPTPNIVVIMTDDLDEPALDTMLALQLMPNLKEDIIDLGYKFTESFVTYPLCCPSRATFLTGQYPHNHNVLGNEQPYGGATAIDDSSTLATWFQTAGYHTAWIGKYLNKYGEDKDASSPKDDPTYIPPGWTEWYALIDPTTYYVFDFQINENGTVRDYPRGNDDSNYQTDVLAQLAVNVIQKTSQPFFLVVAPLAPHVEAKKVGLSGCKESKRPQGWGRFIRPDPKDEFDKPLAWATLNNLPLLPKNDPSFDEADMSDKPRWMRKKLSAMTEEDEQCLTTQYHSRLASLLAVDDLIGKVVDALEEANARHTVLIFTSDNGYLQGQHRIDTKFFPYEESIRVPLYMRTPDSFTAKEINALVLNNDLAPTLAELAGVSIPATHIVDGRSLSPLLSNEISSNWRFGFLLESRQEITYLGVRTANRLQIDRWDLGKIAYIEYIELEVTGEPVDDREFYDLKSDPYQLNSLHDDNTRAAEQRLLSEWLHELRNCSGQGCVVAENLGSKTVYDWSLGALQ
jgi:N-acetylglucosamine-6-sulfatase